MKRVVHIMYSGLGGHGSVVFSYLNGEYLENYDHHLLFFGIEDLLPEYEEECKRRNISYSFIRKKGFIKSIIALSAHIRSLNPKLIINHSLPAVVVLMALRIKFILVEHTAWKMRRIIDLVLSSISPIFARKVVFLTPYALKNAPWIVKLFLTDSKVSIISNGIDTIKFSSVEKKIETSFPLIVSHGRLVPQKDFDTMFKGMNRLSKKGFDFKVVIAGDGELEDELKNLVKKQNMDSYVTFAGRLDEDRLVDLLQRANIYVNSSVAETMSTAIMQALSSELLCLVSDIEENTLLVKDGVTGYTFKAKDDKDLADKLSRICTRTDDQIAKRGREFIVKNYSSNKMASNYQELTENVFKGRK